MHEMPRCELFWRAPGHLVEFPENCSDLLIRQRPYRAAAFLDLGAMGFDDRFQTFDDLRVFIGQVRRFADVVGQIVELRALSGRARLDRTAG